MSSSELTRAVVATGFGGPEALSVIETPIGQPGPGEVRLKVSAAGTNPVDYKRYSATAGSDPTQLPMRLGFEAAGIVTAVGEHPDGPPGPVSVGDEVVAFRVQGAYAEQLIVPALSVVPKPPAMSFEAASGMMLTGTTAVHALTAISVRRGETVLIHAASGGVGLMAVQLALHRGARVIGTASGNAHDLLRELGAEPVTYGAGLLDGIRAIAPHGVDAAIDAAGTAEALEGSLALVASRDRIVTLLGGNRAVESGIKFIGNAPGAEAGAEIRAAARLELVRLAEEGKLRVVVAGVYPLTEAAAAHKTLASGHSHGKIVLVP